MKNNNKSLLNLPAIDLLQEFGAGKASPGSGSSASLQSLISAEMILTVCNISLKKDSCRQHTKALLNASDDIKNNIIPSLVSLFENDAKIFDEVVNLRVERDSATNDNDRSILDEKSLKLLETATDYTFKIAQISISLAEYGIMIFNFGWKTIRGDSGVAISSAISSLTSTVFIISLNFQSLKNKDYARYKVKIILGLIKNLESLQHQSHLLVKSFSEHSLNTIPSISKFESKARKMYENINANNDTPWESRSTSDFVKLLNPENALEVIGYKLNYVENLDYLTPNSRSKIAGYINRNEKNIFISRDFSSEIQRFTLAHEVGHALMHSEMNMHRDRPLDGSSSVNNQRDYKEYEADQFAVHFLMPETFIKRRFKQLFITDCFIVTTETCFALNLGNDITQFKNIRDLTRVLSSTTTYNLKHFNSLAGQFGVSVETMAIRIEELKLVEPT